MSNENMCAWNRCMYTHSRLVIEVQSKTICDFLYTFCRFEGDLIANN